MKATIEQHNLIQKKDVIVVGLSGGPDSLAMMQALIELKETYEIDLIAVHINHMFRGALADADEAFVKAFCESKGIRCYAFREPIESIALESGKSFEETGRERRYERFNQVLKEVQGHKIAVAQNKNDVVETFMINLMRGAGIEGLASIDYRRGPIIRPLLDIERSKIEQFCRDRNLSPQIDHTNQENDYTRNKMRNIVLPYLKETFNPSIMEVLSRTIVVMKKEKIFWQQYVEKLFAECCFWEKEEIVIELSTFDRKTEAEKDHLLRYVIELLRGNLVNISSSTIQSIHQLTQTGTYILIDSDYMVMRSYDQLIFKQKAKQNNDIVQTPRLYCKCVDVKEAIHYSRNNRQIHIDADQVKGKLAFRHRQAGDRIRPLGMKGSKKVKDILIDKKVPQNLRDELWLLTDSEKIIWIEDIVINESCKVTKNTKSVMIIGFVDIVEIQ